MFTPIDVSDVRSHGERQLINAIKSIGRSKQRFIIFKAIYQGKKKRKTVEELCSVLPELDISKRKIRVLQLGGELAGDGIVNQIKDKKSGKTAYEKIRFFSKNKKKIINGVTNPKKIEEVSTQKKDIVKIYVRPQTKQKINLITVDDIESFKLVKKIPNVQPLIKNLLESKIKKGFKNIIGETGNFKDWGGEKNDLYSTKIKIKSKRLPTAIAFKGKGTKGKLTLEKMGKRADQVERLFQSPAQVFLIVYNGQIDQIILSHMQAFSLTKAIAGYEIYYGVVDGDDLNRLIRAYNKCFSY